MTTWIDNSFGNDWGRAYNGGETDESRELMRGGKMRKTLTTVRCVPRFGYGYADVRTIDLDLLDSTDEHELLAALQSWFAQRGIADAVYDIATDDDGYFAVINDEAYEEEWGVTIL
jgi:hypothetical protein